MSNGTTKSNSGGKRGRRTYRRGRLDEGSQGDEVMDERGPVSRDEPRRTDMFIRRLSVKVAVALLSRSSFVPYVSSKASLAYDSRCVSSLLCSSIASFSMGHRKGELKREIIQSRD